MGLGDAHHDGSALFGPEQAPAPGATVPVFVRVPHADGATRVWARVPHDAEPTYVEAVVDRADEDETWFRCDVELRNPLTSYRFLLDGGPRGYRWLNGDGLHGHDVPDAADFRVSTSPPPPGWAMDAAVYQVFPDRFARSAGADGRAVPDWARAAGWDEPVTGRGPGVSSQLYGGDLDGIAEHLDHVAALGMDTLYLTPFFPARSNHRYDASSFDRVDPLLGGDAALARLAAAVHARGWHLVGDLTTNHSGNTHDWFRRALADPAAPERDFYYFDGLSYAGWLGHRTLPKFRHTHPGLRERLVRGPGSVAARWLEPPYALDGWRVDVANMTGRHGGDDENRAVARELRATLAAYGPDRVLVAEHCHDASADLAGDGWQGTMNYSGFTRPVWTWVRRVGELPVEGFLGLPVPVPRLPAESLAAAVRAFLAVTPWRASRASWSLLGSHDTARIRSVVGDPDVGEVAAGLLFTLPGVPMVFAGDEIGQPGALGEDSRRPFPWHRRQDWDTLTLARYRALGALRRDSDALRRGGLRWAHAAGDALTFLRESRSERLLVHAARARGSRVRLPAGPLGLDGAAEAANAYGGAPALRADATGMVTLPEDGPTFQVWRI
jgi:alpha-glucosidase